MSGRRTGDPSPLIVVGAVVAAAVITGAFLVIPWAVLTYGCPTRTEIPDPGARITPIQADMRPAAWLPTKHHAHAGEPNTLEGFK